MFITMKYWINRSNIIPPLNFRRILIDSGSPDFPEYITNLKSEITKENLEISDIIITHWHSDHIGGVKDILKHISKSGKE